MLANISFLADFSFIPRAFIPLPADQLIQVAPFGFLVCVALLIDLLIGQAGWLRKLPNLHSLSQQISGFAAKKLDRARRSDADRAMRGMVYCLCMIITGFIAGWLLWRLTGISELIVIVIGILVAQTISIGGTMHQLRALAGKDALSPSDAANTLLQVSQSMLEQFLSGILICLILGPAGLFAWVGLLGIINAGAGKTIEAPAGPFYMFPVLLYSLIAWLPALVLRAISKASGILFPSRKKTDAEASGPSRIKLLPARGKSAEALCQALSVRINVTGEQSETDDDHADWIGFQSGRRAIVKKDIKHALTIAWLVVILSALPLASMLSTY